MRVLVIGSGGREHALCWAIAGSPLLSKLWCAPGNPGIAELAECVSLSVTDIEGIVAFACANAVDLVVPGPEAPLVAGLADALDQAAIPCCGPSAQAARLESSKSFAKELCDAAGIPTARWERFDTADSARDFVTRRGTPLVVKADGLAGGKGVVVAHSEHAALAAIDTMMHHRAFGESGAVVVIEECLHGREISLFALCDGTHAVPIGSAQDHKRAGEGDTGPNTGGMGAISPAPVLDPALEEAVMDRIVRPALAEMTRRGTPFRGVLFAGLMLTEDGLKLIEFNARFGDPECQAVLPRLRSDVLPALMAACDGELDQFDLRWDAEVSVAVVLAAHGYPDPPTAVSEIKGVERAAAMPHVRVFHAGTTRAPDGRLLATGGRVLTVCATGPDAAVARARAYAAVDAIDWPEGFCRRDIGLVTG